MSEGITPSVPVKLEVSASLGRVLDPKDRIYSVIQKAVAQHIDALLIIFGIPGSAIVEIKMLITATSQGQWMRLHVNGAICRYPDMMLRFVHSYVNGILPAPNLRMQELLDWVVDALRDKEIVAEREDQLATFFGLACSEAIKLQPAVLLSASQVDAYAEALLVEQEENGSDSRVYSATALLPILREVIQLGFSIADARAVSKALADRNRSPARVVEDLVVRLAPDTIDVHVPPSYMTELQAGGAKLQVGLIDCLRDHLYEELGVLCPTIRLVQDNKLKDNFISFRINHVNTLPFLGLRSDQCFVDDTFARLAPRVVGQPTTNPATWRPATVTDAYEHGKLKFEGIITWDQWSFLILALAGALRDSAACFIHRGFTEIQVSQMEKEWPALCAAIREHFSMEEVTYVLRALAAEEVSLRDLRLVFERLLDYEYRLSESSRYEVLDDWLSTWSASEIPDEGKSTDLVSFVRAGMKRQISHKYSRGAATFVTYRLDPTLESFVAGIQNDKDIDGTRVENIHDCILDAIRSALTNVPQTAAPPCILTSSDIRAALRKVIALEQPRIGVVAYQELSSDTNVQPIGTINLSTH